METGKKKVSKKQRLQQIGRESLGFVQPLPSEAKAISTLKDSQLFRSDSTGQDVDMPAPSPLAAATKKSSKVPLSKSTLKQVDKIVKHMETSGSEQQQARDLSALEIRKQYAQAELYDFWSTGEAGLPPVTALTQKQLNGRDPAKVINEWNIDSMERISAKRAQRVHYFNDKHKAKREEQHSALLRDLEPKSYNPAAGEHADSLLRLSQLQEFKERPAKLLRRENDRIEKLRQELLANEAGKQDEEEEDEEDEEEGAAEHEEKDRPVLVRKTKQQRRKEANQRKMAALTENTKRERMLNHLLHTSTKISRDLDKKEEEEEASKPTGARKRKAAVSLNGKRVKYDSLLVGTKTNKQLLLPQIVPPSQLPDKMRVIPGVGSAPIEEQFLKLRATNVVEISESKKRGGKQRATLRPKVRDTDKFDLKKHTVAEPRFKLPAKLRAAPKM